MIQIENITKTFGKVRSLDKINAAIEEGSIYGLIGSNGSGKSTLLRIICGIMQPDEGQILLDGMPVFENVTAKEKIAYISDDQYFIPHSTIRDMAKFFACTYRNFDMDKAMSLTKSFGLDPDRKINTFSKGMQKQSQLILAIASRPKYLLCDETFDGLDPVMRQTARRIFADEAASSGMTSVIASHNLRELEDICDSISLLHAGKLLFERKMDDMRDDIFKVQAVFPETVEKSAIYSLGAVRCESSGSLNMMIMRGGYDAIVEKIAKLEPVYYELLPLTLEEVFICEMEGRGYDFSEINF